MRPGEIVEDRFELVEVAGFGGMGEVFRAVDRSTGEPVALKVLLEGYVSGVARFEREARVLAELRHPGIVRYIAHGVTASGEQYLAMEWLEGQDLAHRLRRSPLSVPEAIELGRCVAEGLAVAHARGIVHRDLKPSNLFLVSDEISRVKVLDFGLARYGVTRVTQTGVVLGTPGYMAPEQARSGQSVDARADVFSLGCLLFECLTGVPAFSGEHLLAILAKILFDEAPRLSELRPDVPATLDNLIARMLAKDPDERPADGAELAHALEHLGPLTPRKEPWEPRAPVSALTTDERRILSVVLIADEFAVPIELASTIEAQSERLAIVEMRREAERYGGNFELLADGSAMVTLAASRVATDQAALAARCALALRSFAPHRLMALSTGRGQATGRLPVGEVIDRAARLLAIPRPIQSTSQANVRYVPSAPMSVRGVPIALDDVTAALLDARFDVREFGGRFDLHGEHELAEGTRTLLGKPTACVGRDRELGLIEGVFAECVEEPIASCVLVTAPAGIGKSRLAQEAIQRAQRYHERVTVWQARGDSMWSGSAFGMIAQLIRSATGILDGEPLGARQEKLRAHVAGLLGAPDHVRITVFLGELIGTPLPDEESPLLVRARCDAQLLGEQMLHAFVELVRAECAERPVIMVLDDLHWGDLPTVRFIDATLRLLAEEPVFVLALARPEVHQRFPRLFADRRVQELRLKELTRRASERLVRQVLGDDVPESTISRVVGQSEGNAFFLEELIRAVAEGKGAALPESVLAMVQARVGGLEVEARRVLRAASVYGEIFWEGGVAALMGRTGSSEASAWLWALVERELIVKRAESRFPGEPEFAFRHALLCEGAYATLTDEDLVLGHKLAARWLEARGESDPMVLAEHLERGKERARAGHYYLLAAQKAYQGSDADAVVARAQRALACDLSDPERLPLLGLLCEAHGWRNEWKISARYAREVIRLAEPGSVPWILGAVVKLQGALRGGREADLAEALEHLRRIDPPREALGVVASAFSTVIFMLDTGGRAALADGLIHTLRAKVEPVAESEPSARAWLDLALAYRESAVKGDPYAGFVRARAALQAFEELSHRRGILLSQILVGMNLWLLGAYEEAERALAATRSASDEELGLAAALRGLYLSLVLAARGSLSEAQQEARRMVDAGRAVRVPSYEGQGRWALGVALQRWGELAHAERQTTAAVELLYTAPLDRAAALSTLAGIRLESGQVADALSAAEESLSAYEALNGFGYRGTFARLLRAEALHAAGRVGEAREAIKTARGCLMAQADKIKDPVFRQRFLEKVPENVRTLRLAEEWLSG